MKRRARPGASVSVLVLLVLLTTAFRLAIADDRKPPLSLPHVPNADAISIAVLGDSNSQSYHDDAWFAPEGRERGGPLRDKTFQWTEIVQRLRGHELDLGPWVRWGHSGVVARARELIGLPGERAPAKDDYLYNFANSGAACVNLMEGRFRQAPRLVALMDQDPARWARGVVVIRIGLNDWSGLLELQAKDPDAPELKAVIAHCSSEIRSAIELIRARHPTTRIAVAGIGQEADDPGAFDYFQSAHDMKNLKRSLDEFNGALRQLTVGDPRMAFFDDAQWFESRWGTRGPDGKPNAYKTVHIGNVLQVTNTLGDEPHNALLADYHPGLAFNALWAQSLVERLREAFDLPLTPITDEEVVRFVEPLVRGAVTAPGS